MLGYTSLCGADQGEKCRGRRLSILPGHGRRVRRSDMQQIRGGVAGYGLICYHKIVLEVRTCLQRN